MSPFPSPKTERPGLTKCLESLTSGDILVKKLNADKTLDIDDICKTLRISRSTF